MVMVVTVQISNGRFCILRKCFMTAGRFRDYTPVPGLRRVSAYLKRVVAETAEWVRREMQSPVDTAGGYSSTLDVDSEHEEGKFYVWERDQISQIVTREEFAVIAPYIKMVNRI
jgi:uncharacterized protein YyaL (SSP411 family)